ncbi:MAG: fasciclin domain-containing protein [Bacteroidaceae bacterium]|nr:fasciclin domain-containing protein [Bacteroidaceae bacterium]
MLYNFQRKKLCRHLLVGGALCVAGLGVYSCSDTYDLDTEQPSNLNSIYGYMEDQGNFKTYLRLIEDLGQGEILAKTGSKTMFIADDDAFTRFFASNKWGVRSYEQLSLAQKKLLLNSAMIDNPYSTSMLSTAEGPVKGEVCRRSSSLTLYDSVLVVHANSAAADDILPHNDRFNEIRANHDTIVLYTDASNAAPMVHFNYKFVASNKLESTDIDFLYNQTPGTRGNDDVYVNNAKVIDANIFCKNGFIHKVDEVILPLDNMAEIIRKDPETKIFSGLVERFAAPDYTRALTDAYNVNKGASIDSVFNKRYFSDRSAGSTRENDQAYDTDKNGGTFDASLKFDPGWNGYMPLSGDPRDAMMEDLAVMLVPTDSAMNEWWNNGGGKVVQDYYGTIERTPNSVLDDLIRVNQLISLVASVPSRFEDVLNDANEPLGITEADVKSVTLGCNGVIYKTNKVFAPTSYSSVLFPAVIDTTNFKIIENAISNLDYDKYLNSMVSEYVFIIPTNDGLLSYVDPVSYGQTTSQLWEFHFDATKSKAQRIYADVYKCNLNETTGKWEKDGDKVFTIQNQSVTSTSTALNNRLEDLLDNIIVTTGYEAGKKYYRTKGNTFVRIDGITEGSHVYGAFQAERDYPLTVQKVYNMENGHALVVDGPVMGSRKSVAMTLSENPDFSEFLGIMQQCGALANSNGKDKWTAVASAEGYGNLFNLKTYGDVGAEDRPASGSATQKATYILNNYHYTVYAPTNAAMQKAYDMGLPSLADLAEAEEYDREQVESGVALTSDSAARVREAMLDFVKYHIQDNSVYVDSGFASASYESAKTELIASTTVAENVPESSLGNYTIKSKSLNADGTYNVIYYTGKYSPGRPYKIKVDVSANGMTVTDNIGQTHNVIMTDGMYNLMANEYWIKGTMALTANPYQYNIDNSSSVAIHAIDGPLVYADGKHTDAEGNLVPTQFIYKYKPLTSEAKRR